MKYNSPWGKVPTFAMVCHCKTEIATKKSEGMQRISPPIQPYLVYYTEIDITDRQ